eukprot:gene23236-biopygen13357
MGDFVFEDVAMPGTFTKWWWHSTKGAPPGQCTLTRTVAAPARDGRTLAGFSQPPHAPGVREAGGTLRPGRPLRPPPWQGGKSTLPDLAFIWCSPKKNPVSWEGGSFGPRPGRGGVSSKLQVQLDNFRDRICRHAPLPPRSWRAVRGPARKVLDPVFSKTCSTMPGPPWAPAGQSRRNRAPVNSGDPGQPASSVYSACTYNF